MPKPKTCSVCCIAMLTGETFTQAMKRCFDGEPEDYSIDFELMEKILNRAGLRTRMLDQIPSTLNSNLLIECYNQKENFWHYIVYDADAQKFLDPIPGSLTTEDYEFYRVIEVF